MLSTKNKVSRYVLLMFALLLTALALHDRASMHYPYISLTNPDQVKIDFLWQADVSAQLCQDKLNLLDEVALADCPNCQITVRRCLAKLDSTQATLLGSDAVDFPTERIRNGVIAFQSNNPESALQACQNAQDLDVNYNQKTQCTLSNMPRPINTTHGHIFWASIVEVLLLLVGSSLISWVICYLILRYDNLHAHFSHDHVAAGVQKFHTNPTPRIAGIAFLACLLASLGFELIIHKTFLSSSLGMAYFILACLPVFIGGILEDTTKNVGVAQRLLFSILSALLAIWLLGGLIDRTDIATLDGLLTITPLAIAFTVLGIAGVCNAFNIIDGYNGLSAGYASIALTAIACVAFQLNDHLILGLSLSLLGGLLGFLYWNWPHGKIFMGDGGAYLVGFSLAELAILLVYRNPAVSPWFTAIILAYPITETVVSMTRRKFITRTKTGQPDAAHMHHLLYFKIKRHRQFADAAGHAQANSRVALFIWLPAVIVSILATLFYQSTAILLPMTLVGCALFVLIYCKLLVNRD